MSSNSYGEPTTPVMRQPQSISQLATIEIEQPSRKMRLLFGKDQAVFIRSDGLRSRSIRDGLKTNDELSDKKKHLSETMDLVIDSVAKGTSGEKTASPSPSASSHEAQSSSSQSESSSNRKRPNEGNRTYHPPKQFHGESTMVPHKKSWTYQTACNINAEEINYESDKDYIASPFYPMPRSRNNEICTATRMNYASQRLDNRKFRGQEKATNQISTSANDSITCERCGMRFFYESKQVHKHIHYVEAINETDLPTVLFDCPVCGIQTKTSTM